MGQDAQGYASDRIFIHLDIDKINKKRCIIIELDQMKARRQAAIVELVDREALHSQEQLRRRLHHSGFDATQATISRDIKELGLVKRAADGAYQRPGVDTTNPQTARTALERATAEFLRRAERVQQLVVIR